MGGCDDDARYRDLARHRMTLEMKRTHCEGGRDTKAEWKSDEEEGVLIAHAQPEHERPDVRNDRNFVRPKKMIAGQLDQTGHEEIVKSKNLQVSCMSTNSISISSNTNFSIKQPNS
eukprot:749153-Hanusia_phi.AAC.1